MLLHPLVYIAFPIDLEVSIPAAYELYSRYRYMTLHYKCIVLQFELQRTAYHKFKQKKLFHGDHTCKCMNTDSTAKFSMKLLYMYTISCLLYHLKYNL